MTITWGRLHRRKDKDEQVAGVGADKHGSRSSEDVQERQRRRRELEDERARGGSAAHFWDFPSVN